MTGLPGMSLLLLLANRVFLTAAKATLPELRPDSYADSLAPRKNSLLYFSNTEFANNVIFLEELQKSAGVLEDYGIYVAKVICVKYDTVKFCSEGNAYLFRGTKLLREFPTDTLFDVNAIVANVLFVLLYNKVKYVTSILELQNLEDAMKGKKNVIFVYVQAVGTPEHRSVMEAVFIHGSTHQFVLTTESSLLKSMSTEEPSQVSAKLFFIHCKSETSVSHKCHRTMLEHPLTTLNIHRFLKVMGLPLVGEVSGDAEKFNSVHLQLGLPAIFIVGQQETYGADLETAEEVARQLLGKAGVAILLREKSGIQIPPDTNVGIKRAEENSPVKYMKLEDIQQILNLLHVTTKEEAAEETKDEPADPEVQDDEVAEAVYRDKNRSLPLQLVPSMTDETFKMVPLSPRHTAVLFYMSWDPVSLSFLESVTNMAAKYKDLLDVSLARVNCADWTDVCSKENITTVPVIRIYQAGQEPFLYTGMMGTDELASFLMLMKQECPLQLSTVEEAEEYLSGKMPKKSLPDDPVLVLGIFTPDMDKATNDFITAGKDLRGFASVGIYTGEKTSVLAEKYDVHPPAVLFSRQGVQKVYGVSLHNIPRSEVLPLLRRGLLGEFPEVRVETLPSLLQSQRALLILFSDGPLNHGHEKHILGLVRGKYLESYLACWLNLKETPVAYEILKKYFGVIPHLPVLVLVTFGTQGQVFALPADQLITEVNILYWLEMVKAGEDAPVYSLSNEDWGPPLPDYDFLAMMDAADPSFAAQKIRINMKPRKRKKAELTGGDEGADAKCRPGRSLCGTVPRFLESEEVSEQHTEL
ncbi:PREDICTED: thioredoxin domain-containing protein 16 [Nanorana parkeri]|uniref:thioredoxin domain-containing protein 16 n=1 Tax=Nanorana parkeri TaxID=125878 RepID=UPI0008548D5E|nr:PREDICTED: thioredoxin domain-containing protein 16 [Nanorana parkeri]